jgi:NAD(P)-dependent dehydrogenase (short-subunit alcohol dehydrogenase family)
MSHMVRQVFITGATSGIGEAVAQAFKAEGAHVVATGATKLEVENAAQKPANAGIDFRVLDVRDLSAVQGMVGSLAEIDVVVNCAGIIQRSVELEPEAFARTIDINLNGTMRVCAAAREGLKARRGCIINTASMLSFFGGGLVPGYSASKGGVAQLTKSLAIAYADDGIRVNAVAPGWIATPLTQLCKTTHIGANAHETMGITRGCGRPRVVFGQPASSVCHRGCVACRRWLFNFLNQKDSIDDSDYAVSRHQSRNCRSGHP